MERRLTDCQCPSPRCRYFTATVCGSDLRCALRTAAPHRRIDDVIGQAVSRFEKKTSYMCCQRQISSTRLKHPRNLLTKPQPPRLYSFDGVMRRFPPKSDTPTPQPTHPPPRRRSDGTRRPLSPGAGNRRILHNPSSRWEPRRSRFDGSAPGY